jgi:DNA-binding NtrC family response regulator
MQAGERAEGPNAPRADGKRRLVVIVDDDPTQCLVISRLLVREGYGVEVFHDGQSALDGLALLMPDCLCLDMVMPGLSGIEVLERIRSRHLALPVIVLTADTSVGSVVEAMRLGAYDYLAKPIDRTRLATAIRNAVERHGMERRLKRLERVAEGRPYPGIVGSSPRMRDLFAEIDRVAASDITVLVHGESGTGKELVARAIHDSSGRRSGPFLAINCAAVPEPLMESELFGHEAGAFTGAASRRRGMLELADGGTLLLDEIGELPQPLQAKLLRALQERRFRRVGGTSEIASDFRLLAATNRNLADDVRSGRFREDLYFRVAVFEIEVPPLRERRDDTPLLARHFADELAAAAARPGVELSNEACAALVRYDWPGNVRELRNTMERALVVCDGGTIRLCDLPQRLQEAGGGAKPAMSGGAGGTATWPGADDALDLAQLEHKAIAEALRRAEGNHARAAKLLGLSRATLYRKLKQPE